MSKDKPNDSKPAQPAQDQSKTLTEALTTDWSRSGYVSNTMPAPPNPHQDGGQKEKK